MTKKLPSPELLHKILRYDADTGKLYWRTRTPETLGATSDHCHNWNRRYAGKEAFTTRHNTGHLRGWILDQNVAAQRVIWAMTYGKWPTGSIKHINGDNSDNRIENLTSTDPEDARILIGTYETWREAVMVLARDWVDADMEEDCIIKANNDGTKSVWIYFNPHSAAP